MTPWLITNTAVTTELCHSLTLMAKMAGRLPVYKDNFTFNDDGIPVCLEGHHAQGQQQIYKGQDKIQMP